MIRVLVVDDSRLIREVLRSSLSAQEGIEVVATAANPYEARREIVRLKPDVMTLDLEMPRMGGLTFLRKLMDAFPMPVVVLSAFGDEGSDVALQALETGAVAVVRKADSPGALREQVHTLAQRIRLAAIARVRAAISPAPAVPVGRTGTNPAQLVAIGASTGGTRAFIDVFARFPANMPPVVVVQHMPREFIHPFVARLQEVSALDVREARDAETLRAGTAYVAPGGKHLEVVRAGGEFVARVFVGEPVNHCIPSVDVLFRSVARAAGRDVVAALLTGMGRDGAEGLFVLKESGATTIAQDEASSVVWGMPGRAVELGAADLIVSLDDIPLTIVQALRGCAAEV